MNEKNPLILMLIFAIIAALLLILIIITYTPTQPLSKNERILIGSLFIIISIVGIYSAFRPGRFRRIFTSSNTKKKPTKTTLKKSIELKGHHPNCEKFKNHAFHFKNHILCTGCYGLVTGSITAILIMIFYALLNYTIPSNIQLLLFILGLLLILTNYIETIMYHNTKILHLLSNGSLILGFLFIVLALSEITGGASYGIIAIIFSVLWLDVRIHLSQFKHKNICQSCHLDCKYFE